MGRVLLSNIVFSVCILAAFGNAQAQETGKELLGRARNLPLDELMKPHDAKTKPPDRETQGDQIPPPKKTPAQIATEELKRRAQPIPYQSLARAPGNHVGSLVTMRGRVAEVVESYGHLTLRINVTRGQFDQWSDTVYVEHKRQSAAETRILEKDIVAIWGKFEGIKSYTTVLGATVQIPHVNAVLLEHSNAPPPVITRPGQDRGVITMPPPSN